MTDVKSAIIVEQHLPYPLEAVWRMLSEPVLLANWLMPTDFKPVLGHRFTFMTKPVGDWDGTIRCEVLEIVPPRRLRYSWIGGLASNAGYGSRLDSIVTWSLSPQDGGTLLQMEHAGFGPDNAVAFNAMKSGWRQIVTRIETLLGESV